MTTLAQGDLPRDAGILRTAAQHNQTNPLGQDLPCNYGVGMLSGMGYLRFVWDPRKAKENARKHGVTFEEAKTVFLDDYAVLIVDPDHSDAEDRFLLLGVSSRLRLLVVCHGHRGADGLIRLISARKADRIERRQYTERSPR